MKTEIKTITPTYAQHLLERNINNRKISRTIVGKFATSMQEGRWKLNGEAIKINCDGSLIDGQHRLSACIKADAPFESLVISELPVETFDTLDTGKKRSNADTLYVKGEANCTLLASATAIVAHYSVKSTKFNSRFDNDMIWKIVEQYPEIRKSVGVFAGKKPPFNNKFLVALHFLAKEKYGDNVDEFCRGLFTGAELPENSPVLLLRDTMQEWQMNKERRRTQVFQFACMIKAWNAYIGGKILKQLRFNEKMNEEFPRI